MKKALTSIKKRVEAGVAYLNAVQPQWLKKIDIAKLDMGNPNVCVIGEVLGHYGKINELGIDKNSEASIALGFYCDNEEEYPALTRAWKKKIKELRGE